MAFTLFIWLYATFTKGRKDRFATSASERILFYKREEENESEEAIVLGRYLKLKKT